MGYLFENLSADRFQELCQTLLLEKYPDLQCFPVGQPDGGRDALSRAGVDGQVVGQVKFRKSDEPESAKWMISALEKELPKIKRLTARGASSYIMVTNARGSAHLDGGRIDLVQAWLNKNVGIPATCLWRADVERRLDRAPVSVKLSFPSILTGDDALALVIHGEMRQRRDRIDRALQAFVAYQYRKDAEVKFRQVDLANSLLGLFVDVPVNVGPLIWSRKGTPGLASLRKVARRRATMNQRMFGMGDYPVDADFSERGMVVGTADLLLDPDVQRESPWVVLQGGPGQGKSTLAQYVCQVHRARYLGKDEFLAQLPADHGQSPFRLPFKVDLRDFASYLDGQPYLGREKPSNDSHKTLERFIASLVSIQAGGLKFSPDDLVETLSRVPALLFLDGLDEVADLDLRQRLVVQVVDALARMRDVGAATQVVVTSRPALFGRGPSFPRSDFARLDLAIIGQDTIRAYAQKWVVARRLDDERASEVIAILEQKLQLPHIGELTRNPMQLTILLNLIHSIGYSLPDIRTDLYRQYVDLFMTREAEKDATVREHRQLLLDVVEYLAWTLQCQAESGRSSGSITRDNLRDLVSGFLERGMHDMSILDELFTGGLERVYVLVQRIEGLYEFEVQPLREYFAAKYLYSTAPSASFRYQNLSGDRQQRFEAMAGNPYWANVIRFYAGFYQGGEVAAIPQSLTQLSSKKPPVIGYFARSIGAALLTDWVFRGKKAAQNETIEFVFDEVGLGLASLNMLSGFEGAVLDKECGRDIFADRIFSNFLTQDSPLSSISTARLLRRNGGAQLASRYAKWILEESGGERTRRMIIGLASRGVEPSETAISELMYSDKPNPIELNRRTTGVIRHMPELFMVSTALAEAALTSILEFGGADGLRAPYDIARFSNLLAGEAITRFGPESGLPIIRTNGASDDGSDLGKLPELVEILEKLSLPSRRGLDSWSDPTRWTESISQTRAVFGETWATYALAIRAVGYVAPLSKAEIGELPAVEKWDLFSTALVARSWRGKVSFWTDRLASSQSNLERLFWLAMTFSWAPSNVVKSQLGTLRVELEELDEVDFYRLNRALRGAAHARVVRGGRPRTNVTTDDSVSPRLLQALITSFGTSQLAFVPAQLRDVPSVARASRSHELWEEIRNFPGWTGMSVPKAKRWLSVFEEARTQGVHMNRGVALALESGAMPGSVAATVLSNPAHYNRWLVEGALHSAQLEHNPLPVREIAISDNWTFD